MTDIMHWAQFTTLILLAWLGLAVVVAAAFHLALAPRREERRYRRWMR